jgi:hypothetical protein
MDVGAARADRAVPAPSGQEGREWRHSSTACTPSTATTSTTRRPQSRTGNPATFSMSTGCSRTGSSTWFRWPTSASTTATGRSSRLASSRTSAKQIGLARTRPSRGIQKRRPGAFFGAGFVPPETSPVRHRHYWQQLGCRQESSPSRNNVVARQACCKVERRPLPTQWSVRRSAGPRTPPSMFRGLYASPN